MNDRKKQLYDAFGDHAPIEGKSIEGDYISLETEMNVCERPPITQEIKGGEKSICWSCFHWEVCFAKENQPCVKCTRYIPAADVRQVVHAHWMTWEERFPGLKTPRKNRLGVFCSNPECNKHADNMFDFCPNCGADMREEIDHD